jgi:DNA polymerase-3 subunit alpha
VRILAPHVNHSEREWSLEGKAVRAGLHTVKGLSSGTVRAIVVARKVAPFHAVADLRRRVRFRRPELQNLIHSGACDGLGATRPVMLNRLRFAVPDSHQPLLFDIYRDRVVERLPDYDRVAKLKAELDVIGIPFSLHPAVLLPPGYVPATRLGRRVGRETTVAGFVAAARRARTQDGRVMGFVTLEDATGLAEISFFPDHLKLYRTICSYGGPVWVRGKVTEHLASLTLEGVECGQVA